MNEPTTVITGNLTADPELRFTSQGTAVTSFTIASTPKTFNRQTNTFDDGETLFMRCTIWREYAENVAESLRKGMRVIVSGKLTQRSFQDRDGNKRSVVELDVDEIGPCLRFTKVNIQPTHHMPQNVTGAGVGAPNNAPTHVDRGQPVNAPQNAAQSVPDPWEQQTIQQPPF